MSDSTASAREGSTVRNRPAGKRSRVRATPKGRRVDPQAREDILSLIRDEPRRRDLLIQYLHRIQDRFGCISAAHMVALADEMKLAMAEVYEVATFYHHFDVVKEGDAPPPPITVRVCDSIACELAGSHELLHTLPAVLGPGVRVLHAPCVGRCETAPVAVVGQRPVPHATSQKVSSLVAERAVTHSLSDPATTPGHIDYAAYRAAGGYTLAAACVAGQRTAAEIISLMEDSGLRGLGGAGFPAGRKWKIVSAEPAPRLLAVNIDEGEPGTFKDRYYLERDPHRFLEYRRVGRRHRCRLHLPARRVPRLSGHPGIGARGAAGRSTVRASRGPPPSWRGRLHLRRRVFDDRVD
jgi:formate dehydrogenase